MTSALLPLPAYIFRRNKKRALARDHRGRIRQNIRIGAREFPGLTLRSQSPCRHEKCIFVESCRMRGRVETEGKRETGVAADLKTFLYHILCFFILLSSNGFAAKNHTLFALSTSPHVSTSRRFLKNFANPANRLAFPCLTLDLPRLAFRLSSPDARSFLPSAFT